MYHMVFDDNGYYFLSTSDIETGLMFCKGKTEKPNIVLLDILLPSKNKEIDKERFNF